MVLKQDYMVVPELEMVDKVLKTDLDENIVSVYQQEMIRREADIQVMETEIERLESIKNNHNAELVNSQKTFLKGKQTECDYLRVAAGIKIAYLNKKMEKEEYSKLRDNILTAIILERAKIKRYLSYIRLYAKRNNMILNQEWFERFDTIIPDDCNKALNDLERSNEVAKDLLNYVSTNIKDGVSILPEEDKVKDAMMVIDLIPTYLNKKGHNKR